MRNTLKWFVRCTLLCLTLLCVSGYALQPVSAGVEFEKRVYRIYKGQTKQLVLKSEDGSDSEDGLTWATVDRYMIEDHDWSAPSDYEAQRLVNLYRGALGELGLVVAYDVRTAKREAPEDPVNYDWAAAENALYTQEPAAVYGLTDGYAPLWRVVSWNRPDAGLALIREGSGLDADQ